MQDAAVRGQEGQPQLRERRAILQLAWFLVVAASLAAQATSPQVNVWPSGVLLCNSDRFQHAKQLTLRQRACWFGSELISPGAVSAAAFRSAIGQWRNVPYIKAQDGDDYTHRFAAYYVRRASRETGEMLAGYLDHEDPRPRASGETVFGKRMRSALLSVLIVKGEGDDRPALAPMAGSLAAGFAGAASYREHTGARYALEGAGISYSGYFGRALYQEFRPDIRFFVRRMLHKTP
jgi:hypothetical protein